MVRVPIGGSDFSTHEYAYNELPAGDAQLANFSLTVEDFNYKVPTSTITALYVIYSLSIVACSRDRQNQ